MIFYEFPGPEIVKKINDFPEGVGTRHIIDATRHKSQITTSKASQAGDVVPLRHLRYVPPDSIATVINSSQIQILVNSITLCILHNFERKNWGNSPCWRWGAGRKTNRKNIFGVHG